MHLYDHLFPLSHGPKKMLGRVASFLGSPQMGHGTSQLVVIGSDFWHHF